VNNAELKSLFDIPLLKCFGTCWSRRL